MKKTNLNKLVGKEMKLNQLNEEMVELGYYGEEEAINEINVIETGVIAFIKEDEMPVLVNFKVTIGADEEEALDNTYVEIIAIA